MEFFLENNDLKVVVDKKGAELIKVLDKNDDSNYIWDANPKYWSKHSPNLFPIIGVLENNYYIHNDKKFILSKHGFAREKEFDLLSKEEKRLILELKEDNDTFSKYPFKFIFQVAFELLDRKLKITYRIQNLSDEDMYFSVGGHPAIACPFLTDRGIEDYYIEFEEDKDKVRFEVELKSGMVDLSKEDKLLIEDNKYYLKNTSFNKDAIILKVDEVGELKIKNIVNKKTIKMKFNDFDYVGIWSKSAAPFVCIEPWNGLPDVIGRKRNLKEKEGIKNLKPSKTIEYNYTIEFM